MSSAYQVSLSIRRSPEEEESDQKGLFELTLTDHEHNDDKIARGIAFLDLHDEVIPGSGTTVKEFLETFLSGSSGIETDGLNFGRFLLAQLLIDPLVKKLWEEIQGKKRALRLRLVLPKGDSGVLADLPFELLADEDGFLFRRDGAALIRVIRDFDPRELSLPTNAPLLVAWANPPDTTPIPENVFKEHEEAATASGGHTFLYIKDPCRRASLKVLKSRLTTEPKAKLLSLVAHGDENGGNIYLHQEKEPSDETPGEPVAASDLARVLKSAGVDVVFLWSCFGAKHNATLGSLAATLLNPQEGDISVVVASHAALAASETPKVFQAILDEVPTYKGNLEQAVAAGRVALPQANLQWAAPAYYARTKHQSAQVGQFASFAQEVAVSTRCTVERAPPPLPYFMGRDDKVSRGVALLEANRLVSVTGSPGMGKTEVALAIARKVAEDGHLHDRVLWLSLGGLQNASLLRARLAIAFDTDPQQCPDDEALARVIDKTSVLLVLDNAEDPLADDRIGVGSLLGALLRLCPRLRFLLSTREPLGDLRDGKESLLRLEPLSPSSTRELLLALAGEKLTAEERNSATLGELIGWLDGHPLSITLVASRAGISSLEKLWSRLLSKGTSAVQRPDLDGIIPEAEQARSLRLESCIDLSFLPLFKRFPEAAEMFLWLGYFPAGLPAPLVSLVFGEDAEEHRAVLLRKHLAEEVGFDRRLALPFPLQSYARARRIQIPVPRQNQLLTSSFSALAGWLTLLHQQLGTPKSREIVDRAIRLEANLALLLKLVPAGPTGVLARQIGVALQAWGTVARYGGLLAGSVALLQQGLFLFKTPPSNENNDHKEGEARLREVAGNLAMRTEKLTESGEHYAQALSLFQNIDNKLGQANTLRAMGDLAMRKDNLTEAIEQYAQALNIFQNIDNKLGQANTLRAMGDLAMLTHRRNEAGEHYAQALHIFQNIDSKLGQADTLRALGDLAMRKDELTEAGEHYAQALHIFQKIEEKLGQANTRKALGDLAMRKDELTEAGEYYAQALSLFQNIDDKIGQANTRRALGDLAMRKNDLKEAAEHHAQALHIFQKIEEKLGQANTLRSMGNLAMRTDNLTEAGEHYAQALNIFQNIDNKLGQANTLDDLGDLAMRTNNLKESAKHYAQALHIFQNIEEKISQANTRKALGDLAMRKDELTEAGEHYAQALHIFQKIDNKLGQANTLRALGDLAMLTDRLNEAAEHYAQALHIFQNIEEKLGQANTLDGLGNLRVGQGSPGEAFAYHCKALSLHLEVNNQLGAAASLGYLSRDALMAKDPLRAALLQARCIRKLDHADTGFGQMLACRDMAQAFSMMGQKEAANLAFLLHWSYAARIGHPIAQQIEQQEGRPALSVEQLRPILDEVLKYIEAQFAHVDPLAPLEPEQK